MSEKTAEIREVAGRLFGWHNLGAPVYRYLPLAIVMQGALIAYQAYANARIEDLGIVLENVAGATSIATAIYGLVLLLVGAKETLRAVSECFGLALSEHPGDKTDAEGTNRQSRLRFSGGQRAVIMLMPIALFICHLGLMFFVFLLASLVINAPFVTR